MNPVFTIVVGVALIGAGAIGWLVLAHARSRGSALTRSVQLRSTPPFLIALGLAVVIWGAIHTAH